jgi:hypothetical protein
MILHRNSSRKPIENLSQLALEAQEENIIDTDPTIGNQILIL